MGALLYKSPCIKAVKRPTLNRKLFVSTVKYMLIKFNTQKKEDENSPSLHMPIYYFSIIVRPL